MTAAGLWVFLPGEEEGGDTANTSVGSVASPVDPMTGSQDASADEDTADARSEPAATNASDIGQVDESSSGSVDTSEIAPETFQVVTATDLEPFLVRGSDLPIGWVTIAASPSPASGDQCLGSEGAAPTAARASARTSMQRGSDGPVLSNTVIDYVGEEAAMTSMQAVRSALDACAGRSAGPGQAVVTPVSVATSADEAVAATIAVDANGAQVMGKVIYARVGRRVTYVLALAGSAEEITVADSAAEVVVGRLASA